jgi:hypothetical protein
MTAAYYTEKGTFFNVANAFQAYGFQSFSDSVALGLASDWSDSDRSVVEHIIAAGAFASGDAPLFMFISTQENHGPHPCETISSERDMAVLLDGEAGFERNCSLNEYIRRAASTSAAIEMVLKQLKALEVETGRPYVLMVYGDHQPWSFTDGQFSIAGGEAQDSEMASFAPFRKSDNSQIALYHLLSDMGPVIPAEFDSPIPATLLPTLISAYVARTPDDLYLPANLLAYDVCGQDQQAANCPLLTEIWRWQGAAVFTPD